MMTYHFNVCGVQLQLDAELPIQIKSICGEAFLAPSAPADIRLTLRAVPELPPPPGQVCSTHRERPVWRDGGSISRGCWDLFRPHAHFRTDYALSSPGDISCLVRDEYWNWATRSHFLWPGIMLNYLLLHFRTLIFHASYVGHRGSGILFTAPSGTGKSTQAELWRTCRGAQVVNGDKAGVSLRDVPTAHGVPFSGTSGICENVSLPLKAIVVLSQAPENTVRRLGTAEAAAALYPNLFVDGAVAEESQLALNLLLDLISAVPVYALACTPDEGAVEALERTLYPKDKGGFP